MKLDTTALNIAGAPTHVALDGIPDVCPLCHRSIHPQLTSSAILHDQKHVQAVFRCTHHECEQFFIAKYIWTGSLGGRSIFSFTSEVAPVAVKLANFPETIRQTSPAFVDIYQQSVEAESMNLTQLVGIGLRKSLEFLIKDFVASEQPDKENQIRSALLSACINNYVSDHNVKECAKRAAWLGNDETHYTRKWESKDINDLKVLVRLTVNWVDNSLLTKQYISEMPD